MMLSRSGGATMMRLISCTCSIGFDRLRDAPRIALAESLLPLYRRHMKPTRTPELFIISDKRKAA
jgi:hypothetical protein